MALSEALLEVLSERVNCLVRGDYDELVRNRFFTGQVGVADIKAAMNHYTELLGQFISVPLVRQAHVDVIQEAGNCWLVDVEMYTNEGPSDLTLSVLATRDDTGKWLIQAHNLRVQ